MIARGLRRAGIVAALAATALLAGCAASSAAPSPTPLPTGSGPYPAVAAVQPKPAPAPADPVHDYAEGVVARMSLQQRLASLLMVHVPGTDPAVLKARAAQWGVGGLILMGDNVGASAAEVAAMLAAAQPDPGLPLLTAVDEEGGEVRRLPGDVWPAGIELAREGPEATAAAFADRGALVASAGIAINFGVVADTTDDRASFIYDRVLGTTPQAAAVNVAAAVTAEDASVWTTLKHFPGHGAVAGDSHSSVPQTAMSLADWEASGALPFRAGIEAGAELVMTTHIVYSAVDALPASLSPVWQGILRDELGFQGVIVSDDMLMLQHSGIPAFSDAVANAVAAVKAGTDLLLYVLPADPSAEGADPGVIVAGLAAAVADGTIPQARVTAAAVRVAELRLRLLPPGALGPQCFDACRAGIS